MSRFDLRPPRAEEEEEDLPDLLPGATRLSGPAPEPSKPSGAHLRVITRALSAALKLVESSATDPELRTHLSEVTEMIRSVRTAEDLERVRDRLISLERAAGASAAHGAGPAARDLYQRALAGAAAIAGRVNLESISAEIAVLREAAEVGAVGEEAARHLDQIYLEIAERSGKVSRAGELMKRCVSDMIGTLESLTERAAEGRNELGEIRSRLDRTLDETELEAIRLMLLAQVEALVEESSARDSMVEAALQRATESRRRAAKLEAELDRARGEARTDPLTGLGNRLALAEAIALHASATTPTGMLLLDIDHFKKVNDLHGHGVGDSVLRFVAELLRGELRGNDQPYRMGGEEFLVLLPNSEWQGTRATGERLRKQLAGSTLAIGASLTLRVTVSVGVAVLAPGSDPEAALALADQALYRAKSSGRNRVVG